MSYFRYFRPFYLFGVKFKSTYSLKPCCLTTVQWSFLWQALWTLPCCKNIDVNRLNFKIMHWVIPSFLFYYTIILEYIVAYQAHPALVKQSNIGPYFSILSSLSVCIRLARVLRKSCACHQCQLHLFTDYKGLTACVSSRPGAKAVLRRPRLAGTQQYIWGHLCELQSNHLYSSHAIVNGDKMT